jgi:hypothetical protein
MNIVAMGLPAFTKSAFVSATSYLVLTLFLTSSPFNISGLISAAAQELQTFDFVLENGNTYQVSASGPIDRIYGNDADKSIVIELFPAEPGTMRVVISRDVMDSLNPDGTDRPFLVLMNYDEFQRPVERSDGMNRTLEIQYTAGTEVVEIIGTQMVPEFGSMLTVGIAFVILGITVTSVYWRSRCSNVQSLGIA